MQDFQVSCTYYDDIVQYLKEMYIITVSQDLGHIASHELLQDSTSYVASYLQAT